jgi:hypothetical protein
MIPNILGGSSEIDPDAIAQAFSQDAHMAGVIETTSALSKRPSPTAPWHWVGWRSCPTRAT